MYIIGDLICFNVDGKNVLGLIIGLNFQDKKYKVLNKYKEEIEISMEDTTIHIFHGRMHYVEVDNSGCNKSS